MTLIFPSVQVFFDSDGTALENGYIYIGEAGMDARENPIQVYWDEALTQTAAQPIRTEFGFPTYQGTASALYIAEDACTITTLDRFQRIVLQNAANGGATSSAIITFTQAGTGAVERDAQDKMRERLSVADFGAMGNGIANDTTAIQNAINEASVANAIVYFQPGTYLVTSVEMKDNVTLQGDGDVIISYSGTPAAGLVTCDTGASNWSLNGITLQADSGSENISLAHFVEPGDNISFIGCTFKDGLNRWALRIELDTAISGLTIEGCTFKNLPQGGMIVFGNAAGSTDIKINGNVWDEVGHNFCQFNNQFNGALYGSFVNVQFNFNIMRNPLNTGAAGPIPTEHWGCTSYEAIGNIIDGGTRGLSGGYYMDGGLIANNIVKNQTSYFLEMGGPGQNVTVRDNYAENCASFIEFTNLTAAYSDIIIENNIRNGSGMSAVGAAPKRFVKALITSGNLKTVIIRGNTDIDPAFNQGFTDLRSTQTDVDGYVEVSGNTCLYRTYDSPFPVIQLNNYFNLIANNNFIRTGAFDSSQTSTSPIFVSISNLNAVTKTVVRRNVMQQGGTITGSIFTVGVGTLGGATATPGVSILDNFFNGTWSTGYAINAPFTQGDTVITGNDMSDIAAARQYSLNAAILFKNTLRVFSGNAAPVAGAWLLGDTVVDESPVVGQPIGWKCTVAGTPGTWVALANL